MQVDAAVAAMLNLHDHEPSEGAVLVAQRDDLPGRQDDRCRRACSLIRGH